MLILSSLSMNILVLTSQCLIKVYATVYLSRNPMIYPYKQTAFIQYTSTINTGMLISYMLYAYIISVLFVSCWTINLFCRKTFRSPPTKLALLLNAKQN